MRRERERESFSSFLFASSLLPNIKSIFDRNENTLLLLLKMKHTCNIHYLQPISSKSISRNKKNTVKVGTLLLFTLTLSLSLTGSLVILNFFSLPSVICQKSQVKSTTRYHTLSSRVVSFNVIAFHMWRWMLFVCDLMYKQVMRMLPLMVRERKEKVAGFFCTCTTIDVMVVATTVTHLFFLTDYLYYLVVETVVRYTMSNTVGQRKVRLLL